MGPFNPNNYAGVNYWMNGGLFPAETSAPAPSPLRRGISQGALSLIGAGISSIFNLGSSIYTNWQNKKFADIQYERQKRDIAAQNAYNSPAAQVVRLRAAGINPAMAFQNGISASAGEQSAIASYQRPEYSVPTLDSQAVVSAFTDVGRLENERKSTAASVLKMEKETKTLVQDLDFKIRNQPQLLRQAEIAIEQGEANVDKTRAEYKKVVADTALANINVDKVAQDMGINAVGLMRTIMMLPREMLNMDADTALKYSQSEKNRWDMVMAYANLVAAFRKQNLDYSLGMTSIAATLSGQDVQQTGNVLGLVESILSVAGTIIGASIIGRGRRTIKSPWHNVDKPGFTQM